MTFARFLLSPWVVLASMAGGVAMGVWLPQFTNRFSVIGELYLSLLQLCVLPIMISALFTSLAKLLRTPGTARLIRRIVIVYMGGLFLSSALGMAGGLVFQPGSDLDVQSREVLGSFLTTAEEVHLDADLLITKEEIVAKKHPSIDFIQRMVPTNIFHALAQGDTLKVLFFSMLVGLAVAMAPGRAADRLISDGDVVFQAFVLVIQWLMYLLPLGLPFLVAKQMQNLNADMLGALMLYIIAIHAVCIAAIVVSVVVVRQRGGGSIAAAIKRCREPFLLGVGTANSFAAMPSAIKNLTQEYRFDPTAVGLLLPMGIATFRFGNVILFSLSTVFFAQLYAIPLGPAQYIMLLWLPVLAAVASAGAPGLVAVSMISLVLTPLGLPSEAAVVLLLAVIPIIDPVITTATVMTNMAAAALTAGKAEEKPLEEAEYVTAAQPALAGQA